MDDFLKITDEMLEKVFPKLDTNKKGVAIITSTPTGKSSFFHDLYKSNHISMEMDENRVSEKMKKIHK